MAHYRVTGDGDPSPNGDYYENGTVNDRPKYEREDTTMWIWWDSAIPAWIISPDWGELVGSWWRPDDIVLGDYSPFGDVTGDPTVALIVYAVQIWDGKVLIIDGGVAVHEDCCCEEEVTGCDGCISGNAPDQFRVVLANVADGVCDACEDYNDTYVLDFDSEIGGMCSWHYGDGDFHPCGDPDDDTECHGLTIWLRISDPGFGTAFIEVDIIHQNAGNVTCTDTLFLHFRKSQLGDFDCPALNNLNIPLFADWSGVLCDGSVATCVVTAL